MIYADHAATTPCLPEVAELVSRLLVTDFGNPSSRNYTLGRAARGELDRARERLAAAIGAAAPEVVCTSGATESCNLAIVGVIQRLLRERPKLVVVATEHPAVLEPARACARAGAELAVVPVDRDGRIDAAAMAAAVDERTALVAAMLVNNQTGVINDLPAVAELAHAKGALVLCDATQALGRVPVDVGALGCDLLAASGHKVYGPKGAGLLWLRRGLAIDPLCHGGGQERGLRPGTENVPAIAGFALAVERILAERETLAERLGTLQRRLETGLRSALEGLRIYGVDAPRAPGTTFVGLPGLPRGWLAQLSAVAVSGGSSCATGSQEPSHVLEAMGVDRHEAGNAVRVSLGRDNDAAEVDSIVEAMVAGARRLERGAD